MEMMSICLMVGLSAGGLAIGFGIFRGMTLLGGGVTSLGKSIVRAAKIWSMAQNGRYYIASEENNNA